MENKHAVSTFCFLQLTYGLADAKGSVCYFRCERKPNVTVPTGFGLKAFRFSVPFMLKCSSDDPSTAPRTMVALCPVLSC